MAITYHRKTYGWIAFWSAIGLEWFIWIVPLLAMEFYLSWIPLARGRCIA